MSTGVDKTHRALTAEQRAQLDSIASAGTRPHRRRARLVLMADQGAELPQIAEEVGVSQSRVRYWLGRFAQEGFAIFAPAEKVSSADTPASTQASQEEAAEGAGEAGIEVEALCQRYSVDMAHVQHVSKLAMQLFDAAGDLCSPGANSRRLLAAAAMLHSLGYSTDPNRYHLLAYDIILKSPLKDFSPVERKVLACVVAFGRKKARPERVPAFRTLKKPRQKQALDLAAFLRVANGLDYAYTQTCTITDIHRREDRLIIRIEGEYADLNAVRAEKAADLWKERFGIPLQVREHDAAEDTRDAPWAHLDGAAPVAEAARVLLEYYLMHLERHADRLHEDEVPDICRLDRDLTHLQSVLEVFESCYDVTALTPYKKDVRWLTRYVGKVLQTQALITLTRTAELPGNSRVLFEDWGREAEEASRTLYKALESGRYRRFLTGLLGFCRHPGAGIFPGPCTRIAIGTQAAQWVWGQYTELRIQQGEEASRALLAPQVQRLHHLLHLFGSLFGPELSDVLSTIQPLDEGLDNILLGREVMSHLMQAVQALDGEIKAAGKSKRKQHRRRQSLEALAIHQQLWLDQTTAGLKPLWGALESVEFRRRLALAIAAP